MRNWIQFGESFYRKDDVTRVWSRAKNNDNNAPYKVYVDIAGSSQPLAPEYNTLQEAIDAAAEFVSTEL